MIRNQISTDVHEMFIEFYRFSSIFIRFSSDLTSNKVLAYEMFIEFYRFSLIFIRFSSDLTSNKVLSKHRRFAVTGELDCIVTTRYACMQGRWVALSTRILDCHESHRHGCFDVGALFPSPPLSGTGNLLWVWSRDPSTPQSLVAEPFLAWILR